MEAFFQWNGWNGCTSVGVRPRGAQVRRPFGVRLSADSSKKTKRALCRWALVDPRPLLLDLLVDGVLIALGGATMGRWTVQPSRGAAGPGVGGVVAHPVSRRITTAVRSRVHSSPTNPLAVGPSSRACSTSASCWSDSRGAGPLGPLLRSPSVPLPFQRRCQTLTAWVETPSWRATSAWRTPAANSSAARSRRASSRWRVVAPQGGEGQSACRDPHPPPSLHANPTRTLNPTSKTLY